MILIARPEFLFGHHSNHSSSASAGVIEGVGPAPLGPSERGTASQRLGAVGCVSIARMVIRTLTVTFTYPRVSLIGVLGATGAGMPYFSIKLLINA